MTLRYIIVRLPESWRWTNIKETGLRLAVTNAFLLLFMCNSSGYLSLIFNCALWVLIFCIIQGAVVSFACEKQWPPYI